MLLRHGNSGLGLGQPYNEQAFRHFLAIERERFERSGRGFLLLLLALTAPPGEHKRIEMPIARKLFSNLRLCLRDTDFIGWYHEQRVAGAVLTELGDRTSPGPARAIGQTIDQLLRGRLPPDLARSFQMRVYEDAGPDNADSTGRFTLEL